MTGASIRKPIESPCASASSAAAASIAQVRVKAVSSRAPASGLIAVRVGAVFAWRSAAAKPASSKLRNSTPDTVSVPPAAETTVKLPVSADQVMVLLRRVPGKTAVSMPLPPISVSLPAPPSRESSPALPSIRLSASLPYKRSVPVVPDRFSMTEPKLTVI